MTNTFNGVDWASSEDEDELYQHLLLLHGENGMFTVSEMKVRDFIRQATDQKGAMIGLIRGGLGIEASIGMVIDQWWYSDSWILSERWIFVHPDHRKKNHAARLTDFAKWCDKQLNLPLAVGIMSTTRVEAKERLYRRKFTYVGGFFMDNGDKPIIAGGEEIKDVSPVVHLSDIRKVAANVQ